MSFLPAVRPLIARVALVCAALVASSCAQDDRGHADEAESFDCGSVGAEAEDLRQGTLFCEQDSDCQLVSIDAPCLGDFLCGTIVNASTDVVELQSEAGRLADDYMMHCVGRPGFGCAIADCANPDDLQLRCVDNACTGAP